MSGVPGRLDPSRFGFSMPVTDPPFDRPPYYYRGIEVMGFAYETDDDAAAAIVPEGLAIAHSPAIAQLIFTNFHFSTLGAYTEAILGVSCLWDGEPVIRISVCSWATTTADIDRSVAVFLEARERARQDLRVGAGESTESPR